MDAKVRWNTVLETARVVENRNPPSSTQVRRSDLGWCDPKFHSRGVAAVLAGQVAPKQRLGDSSAKAPGELGLYRTAVLEDPHRLVESC